MQNNDLLITAQNRTTHAVRALAIFFIYSSISSLVGGVIIGISYGVAINSYEGVYSAGGGIVFGAVVAAIGYVVALIVAAAELGKSAFPKATGVAQVESRLSGEATTRAGENACPNCGSLDAGKGSRCSKCDGLLS